MRKSTMVAIIAGIYLFLFYDFLQMDMMNELSPHLQSLFNLTSTQLGIANSLFFYVNFCLLIPVGLMLNKFNPKYLIIISLIINAISQLIFIFGDSYTSLLIWRGGAGVAGAFSYLTALKIISDNFNHQRLGTLIGFSGLSIMLAGIVAQEPLNLALTHWGAGNTLIINCLASLVLAIVIYVLFAKNQFLKSQTSFWDGFKSVGTLLKSGRVPMGALFAGFINMPLFVLGASWGIIYLTQHAGLSTAQASVAASALFAGDIIGAPIMGYISDKILTRVQTMFYGSILNILVLLVLLTFIHTFIVWVILFFLIGFTCTSQTPAYAYVIDCNDKTYAARSSSLVSCASLGLIAIAEPILGLLNQNAHTNTIAVCLVMTSAVSVLLASILLKSKSI